MSTPPISTAATTTTNFIFTEDPTHQVLIEFLHKTTFDTITKPTADVESLIQTLKSATIEAEERARNATLLCEQQHQQQRPDQTNHSPTSTIETEIIKLQQEITTLQEEQTRLSNELDLLRTDQESLKFSEDNLSSLRDVDLKRMYRQSESNSSTEKQITLSASSVLDALSRTSALNEAFFIWKDNLSQFGTINSLRLGTLPESPVEWLEINTALGLVASLVVNIAREVNRPNFKLYSIHPEGNHSYILSLTGTRESLPLYCTGGMFSRASFNSAISAFVQCINELAEYARKEDPTVQLPYPITKNNIGGFSTLYYPSDEKTWTHAMKLLLIDVKWLEAWSVKRRSMVLQ
jgi:beclin 1